MKRAPVLSLLLVFGLLALRADAGIIIATGTNPQPDQENVQFNDPLLPSVGSPLFGRAGQTGLLVSFASDVTLEVSGQVVGALSLVPPVVFDNFIMTMPGSTFGGYLFKLKVAGRDSGTATIVATAVGGFDVSATVPIQGGRNSFTVSATDLDRLVSVSVVTDVALDGVRQNKVSGARSIPAPMPLLLLGVELTGLAMRVRRRC